MPPWVVLGVGVIAASACVARDAGRGDREPVCAPPTLTSETTDRGGTISPGTPPSTPSTPGSEICVDLAPGSPLTLVVTWTTTTPGTSEVTFREADGPTWRIVDPEPTTAHAVTLFGLHADTDVIIDARSVTEAGELQAAGLVARTGSLPAWVPDAEVLVHDAERTQPGWTLLNLSNRDADHPPVAVAYDVDGRPVWFHQSAPTEDHRGDLDVSLTPDGTVLMGGSGNAIRTTEVGWDGVVRWVGPDQAPYLHHHHVEKLADGTYVMLQHEPVPGQDAMTDRIVRYDADHQEVWSWSPLGHIDLPDPTPDDWLHANAVVVTDDLWWLSCRNVHRIYAIDPETGDVVDLIGRAGDRDLTAGAWFANQHAPELQDDGTWLLYDNTGLAGRHTRVLQLAVDDHTVSPVWEFPGDFVLDDPWYAEDWYSSIWGDADRLANGNVLVAAGSRDEGRESRVFEVTPDGEVVWAIRWPDQPGIVGVYRAERVPVPLERVP